MPAKTSIRSAAVVLFAAGLELTSCGEASDETPEASATPSEPVVTVTQTVTEQPDDTASIPDDSDADSAPGEDPGAGFPTSPTDYADALIVAWGQGDKPVMQDLAEPEVVQALEEISMPGGPDWQQTASDAGAGSTFVTYTNTADGAVVELRVRNADASNGQPNAIAEVKVQG